MEQESERDRRENERDSVPPPIKMTLMAPQNLEYITLTYSNRDFADMIKAVEMERLFWITQVDDHMSYH